jgi:transcriptional regulator with XRE-family HTH domain
MPSEWPSFESAFAGNLKAMRKARRMTQAQLAEQMADRGFRWHPATIYKVENGERQIQLGEAIEVARIFDVDVEEMTSGSEAQELVELRDAYTRFRRSRDWLVQQLGRFDTDRAYLDYLLANPGTRELLDRQELQEMRVVADPDNELTRTVLTAYRVIKNWPDEGEEPVPAQIERVVTVHGDSVHVESERGSGEDESA